MSFVTVLDNLNADDIRDWLVTNVGQEWFGRRPGIDKCGAGWVMDSVRDYKEIPAVWQWGITIDDEALAVFFKLRWS